LRHNTRRVAAAGAMEPIPVFDGAEAIAATWSQIDEAVTLWVPLPAAYAVIRPEVTISPQHLRVCCFLPAAASAEDGATPEDGTATDNASDAKALAHGEAVTSNHAGILGAGGGGSSGNVSQHCEKACEAQPGEAAAAAAVSAGNGRVEDDNGDQVAARTLLDNALSGDVSIEESTWTVSDGIVMVHLVKKLDYSGKAEGASLRPLWWPSAVRGGKSGPPDPQAPKVEGPQVHRLDSKIGGQVASKTNFEGKSKFQW